MTKVIDGDNEAGDSGEMVSDILKMRGKHGTRLMSHAWGGGIAQRKFTQSRIREASRRRARQFQGLNQ